MTQNVKSFFENHSHDYANRHTHFYPLLANYLIQVLPSLTTQRNDTLRLLDVGCGDGGFIKTMVNSKVKADYFATDISLDMIKLTKANLTDADIQLIVSDAFNIPLIDELKFDLIHLDSVLHHIVEDTRTKSTERVRKLIEILVSKLTDNGILIVEEWTFLSYIVPKLSSFIIFYGLKIINHLKLDLSFTSEIRPGLEVNFLHPSTLIDFLQKHGEVSLLDKADVSFPFYYKLFLLREKSHNTFVLRKVVSMKQ
jgi:SAM-dependent methyltransferase